MAGRLYDVSPELKADALREISEAAKERARVERWFRDGVRREHKNGCTIREIADAAGYASTSQIQRIIKED